VKAHAAHMLQQTNSAVHIECSLCLTCMVWHGFRRCRNRESSWRCQYDLQDAFGNTSAADDDCVQIADALAP
jgi:hypothetical protein